MPWRNLLRPSALAGATIAILLMVAAPGSASAANDPALSSAMAARETGRTQDAVGRFEALACQRPGDATILRLLGMSYAAAARLDLAATTLDAAQRLAPGDMDISLARGRVALWRNRPGEAKLIADTIGAVQPANVELPLFRSSIAMARLSNRRIGFSASQSVSRVSTRGGKQSWTNTALAGDVGIGHGATLTGEVERFDRGQAIDTRGSLRVDAVIGPGVRGYVGASITPKADFRERWSLRGGGEVRLNSVVSATLDARLANYGGSSIAAVEPGLRVTTRGGRLAVALRTINLIDDSGKLRLGGGGRVDLAISARWRLSAGVAQYQDADAGIVRRVDSAFVGTDFAVTNAVTLRVTVDRDQRVATYRRKGIVVGLRWRGGG